MLLHIKLLLHTVRRVMKYERKWVLINVMKVGRSFQNVKMYEIQYIQKKTFISAVKYTSFLRENLSFVNDDTLLSSQQMINMCD